MPEANATLCTHSGAIVVSRGDLVTIPTPPRTSSFTPVPHAVLVDEVESALQLYRMKIAKEQYAVQTDGAKLFGAITLTHQTRDDFAFALAFRASNNKSMALQFVAGCSVFVCDNMALSGEAIIMYRKHSSGLNVHVEIPNCISRAVQKFIGFDNRIQALKNTAVSDTEAKALMLDAALKGVMPLRYLPDVNKAYFEPPHQEFEPRTQWSLHNAFTEVFKGFRPNLAQESAVELGKLFAI